MFALRQATNGEASKLTFYIVYETLMTISFSKHNVFYINGSDLWGVWVYTQN